MYVKRPSMNSPNHFGAYVNFSNNILWQRFHSLDMLHDKKTLFVLSLLLPCNLYDFLYHKLHQTNSCIKKDDRRFFQFWFDTNNLSYKIRDPTVQRNYSDGQSLFLPKNNTEQHAPTGQSRKGESCNLSSFGILIHVELDRGLAVPEVVGARHLPPLFVLQVSVRVVAWI